MKLLSNRAMSAFGLCSRFLQTVGRATLLSRQRGEARKRLKCRELERRGSREKPVMIKTAAASEKFDNCLRRGATCSDSNLPCPLFNADSASDSHSCPKWRVHARSGVSAARPCWRSCWPQAATAARLAESLRCRHQASRDLTGRGLLRLPPSTIRNFTPRSRQLLAGKRRQAHTPTRCCL
jgi:hypothetical protein